MDTYQFIEVSYLNYVGKNGLRGEIGRQGVIGLDGKQGPPGENSDCIIGEKSNRLVGMQINIVTSGYGLL